MNRSLQPFPILARQSVALVVSKLTVGIECMLFCTLPGCHPTSSLKGKHHPYPLFRCLAMLTATAQPPVQPRPKDTAGLARSETGRCSQLLARGCVGDALDCTCQEPTDIFWQEELSPNLWSEAGLVSSMLHQTGKNPKQLDRGKNAQQNVAFDQSPTPC